MRSPAINEHRVHAFLEGLFAEDLHVKRVLSLSLTTFGGIQADSLSVERLGMARYLKVNTSKARSGLALPCACLCLNRS